MIRLGDGIIAVPLIGPPDSARTQLVTQKLPDTLVTTGAEHAVLDIFGAPAVHVQVLPDGQLSRMSASPADPVPVL